MSGPRGARDRPVRGRGAAAIRPAGAPGDPVLGDDRQGVASARPVARSGASGAPAVPHAEPPPRRGVGAAPHARPRVGVTTSRRGAAIMWWLNALAVWRGGGRPVRLRAGRAPDLDRLDALVVGGGDDIDAELYGGVLAIDVRVDPERDRLELEALDHAARRGLPVLGICRGSQMINVARGGTLHTDIFEVYEKAPRLRTVLPRKRVRTVPGSRLHAIIEQELCFVNSLHHQSVDVLGDGLTVSSQDEQGIVQAIEDPRHPFLVGVQWHPEFLVAQRSQQRLFGKLVGAARARAGA